MVAGVASTSDSSPSSPVVASSLTAQLNAWLIALVLVGAALLAFATATSLVVVRGGLPLATDLAWATGLLVLPSLAVYALRRLDLTRQINPLLTVSAAAGIGSTIVGGTVGASSDATLASAALALVAWAVLQRPPSETFEDRRARRHATARRTAVVGTVAVLLALACLGAYEAQPSVQVLGSAALTHSAELTRGGSARQNLTASPGDFLVAEVAAPSPTSPVVAEILGPGGADLGRTGPGPLQEPTLLNVTSDVPRGTFELYLTFPATASTNLTEAPVNWTFLDVPASDRALAAVCDTTGLGGGTLLILAIVYWAKTRPPPQAPPPLAGPQSTPTGEPPLTSTQGPLEGGR